jgi:hypothetical protein
MAIIVVTILCIVMIVTGGMALSQGILTSADTAAFSVEDISVREGEMTRTELDAVRAAQMHWADLLRITVENSGQTKLASFNKWDLIVNYFDSGGTYHSEWLPYSEESPGENEWQKAKLCLNGQGEFFEPGIMNPEEELVILANLNPPPGNDTTGNITITTPNGINDSIPFSCLSYALLTPHSENMTIAGTEYFELVEATPGDGTAITETTDLFNAGEASKKMMHDENDSSRPARHLFPLTGITQIPAANWTVYYRCRTLGFEGIEENDVNFNISIFIHGSDGLIKTIIAMDAAKAYLTPDEVDTWVTKSATYNFPGYSVADDDDYLEIVYYGQTDSQGPDSPGYMQIRIDDSSLDESYQTRIEA